MPEEAKVVLDPIDGRPPWTKCVEHCESRGPYARRKVDVLMIRVGKTELAGDGLPAPGSSKKHKGHLQ
jgi:hypothetical protein